MEQGWSSTIERCRFLRHLILWDKGCSIAFNFQCRQAGGTVVKWLPLFGIVYDPKDDLVEVALEGLDHLIRKPRDISIEEGNGLLASVKIIDADGIRQNVKL
jgi:Family of unknown function (DUF5335)